MKMWLNHQYPHFFSQIALESISEHVTTKIFWGSAPTPIGNSFIKHPPISIPGYAPVYYLWYNSMVSLLFQNGDTKYYVNTMCWCQDKIDSMRFIKSIIW